MAKGVPESAKTALTALKKLQAKIEAGINFDRYSETVGETLYEVKEFTTSADAKGFEALSSAIADAMADFQRASDMWNQKIQRGDSLQGEVDDARMKQSWRKASSHIMDAAALIAGGGHEFFAEYASKKKELASAIKEGDEKQEKTIAGMQALVNEMNKPNLFSLLTYKRDNYLKITQYLTMNPTLVNAKNDNGMTPLHYCIQYGDYAIAKFLIDHQADVNAKANDGSTPIKLILKRLLITPNTDAEPIMWQDVLKDLLKKGADLQLVDADGNTLLLYLAGFCQKGTAALAASALIAFKADVNAKNKKGNTPLKEARYWASIFKNDDARNCEKFIDLLLKNGAKE
ncbi:MAG: ankyrin repeat domain-containing protein [Planctomycetota bacterium]